MKFNCGPGVSTVRRQKLEALHAWQRRFLWLPVRIADHDCRWLETVEVRYPEACYWLLRDHGGPYLHRGKPQYRVVAA